MGHRKQLKAWFKYHHFHTHPAKKSHQYYISVLRNLEDACGDDLCNTGDLERSWKAVEAAICSLGDSEAEEMNSYRKREMEEMKFRYNP